MGKCSCYPEKETSFMCMKHGVYLCDECLKCRDPNIYCKYRSACPIWFMQKRLDRREKEQTEKEIATRSVDIQPGGRQVEVPHGTTLLETAQQADVQLNAS